MGDHRLVSRFATPVVPVQPRQWVNRLGFYVFMPPLEKLGHYLDLLCAIEATLPKVDVNWCSKVIHPRVTPFELAAGHAIRA